MDLRLPAQPESVALPVFHDPDKLTRPLREVRMTPFDLSDHRQSPIVDHNTTRRVALLAMPAESAEQGRPFPVGYSRSARTL